MRLLRGEVAPVVMEMYAGVGGIWSQVYSDVPYGIAIENDESKVAILAEQRPTWSVYQADCVGTVRLGLGRHAQVNYVDIDPYGEAWSAINALFESDREWPDPLVVVVNDGSRYILRLNRGWSVTVFEEMVATYGNGLDRKYVELVVPDFFARRAATCGYVIDQWTCYSCGELQQVTHFAALLRRDKKKALLAT